MGAGCKSLQILGIGREDGSTRLRHRNDDSVYSRAASGSTAQEGGATRQALRDIFHHVACLQQPVLVRVATGMPLETFDKNRRWDSRGP